MHKRLLAKVSRRTYKNGPIGIGVGFKILGQGTMGGEWRDEVDVGTCIKDSEELEDVWMMEDLPHASLSGGQGYTLGSQAVR